MMLARVGRIMPRSAVACGMRDTALQIASLVLGHRRAFDAADRRMRAENTRQQARSGPMQPGDEHEAIGAVAHANSRSDKAPSPYR